MNKALATKIKEKMEQHGISIYSLEKEAGLKPQAVRNILWGKSKNPGATVLKAIAKVLDCSIDELLEENKSEEDFHSRSEIKIQNMTLYREVSNEVMSLFENHKYEPTEKEFIFLLREVYLYSLERNSGALDKKFADWLYTRNFS